METVAAGAVPSAIALRKPRRRAAAKPPSNVIQLHQRILPRHQAMLARWIDAGRVMGLCDASVFLPTRAAERLEPGLTDYVLVWVRENIDPAYMVVPDRTGWVIVDAVRQQHLARVRTFAAALHLIRPVLPAETAV